MRLRRCFGVAVLLLATPAAVVHADPATSAFVLSAATLAPAAGAAPFAAVATAPGADDPLALNVATYATLPGVDIAGVHYVPRRYREWGRHQDSYAVTQLHAGYFDPEGSDQGPRFLIGLRGGPLVDPHIQLGLGVDWAHKTDNVSSVERTTTGPGGVPITTRQDLSSASTNFVPILGFIQVQADDNLPLIPYFGAGGGYELMFLSADDFQTGNSFDATYGGWGWQAWGGLAIPLSGRTRVTGEVYVNGAELSRDVTDAATGLTFRETVPGDGMGLRFGLAWGF